jgi:hypothetical protein
MRFAAKIRSKDSQQRTATRPEDSMAKPFAEWTVLPHGKLTKLDDNLLTVVGLLRMPPMGDVQRRMTVVRLNDGNSVVYSAICLTEPEMAALESFGPPAYLIVPNDIHRMDVKVWKERYPKLRVIAPAGARAKVEEILPVDATFVDFGDPNLSYITVPGTGEREAALLVQGRDGSTLVLNDVIFNLANRPGLSGWLFKTIGMTGDEPHIPPVVKMRQVKDEAELRAQLERWSRLPQLKRVIISHGDMITEDPAQVLERIAKQLAA